MCNMMTITNIKNFIAVSFGIYLGLAIVVVLVSSILEKLYKVSFDIDKESAVFAILYLIVEAIYVYVYYR